MTRTSQSRQASPRRESKSSWTFNLQPRFGVALSGEAAYLRTFDEEMRHTLITATLALLAMAQAFAEDPGIAKEFHGDWVCVGFIDPDGERHAPKEKHFLKLTADSMTRTSSEGEISEMPPGKIIISKTGELWIEPNGTSERFPLGTAKIEEDELHIRGLPERSHHHLVYKRLPDKNAVEQGEDPKPDNAPS